MAQKITLRDVANHAGVSVTTVSNVVRNWPYVSEETRQKVIYSIQELGYTPNVIAQGLRTGRTQLIGFIAPDIINPHFASMVSTVEDVAQEQGYSVLLFNTHNKPAREAERIHRALHSSLDGLLVVPTGEFEHTVRLLQNAAMPVVFLDRVASDFDHPFCKVDNTQMVRLLMQHLYDLGHRKIAHLSGPPNVILAQERMSSYRQFIHDSGLTYEYVTQNGGTWASEEGYRATLELLNHHNERPTAILASNDTMAIGASRAIREMGLRIPDDISLVGIDDIEICRYLNPALTTVQQPLAELARVSVGMLLGLLQGKPLPDQHVILPPKLIIRDSTASPR